MGFWSADHLLANGQSFVKPFRKDRVKFGAYELSVAGEYYETSLAGGKNVISVGQQIVIPPGQLALLITEERVEIPTTQIAFISIKFSWKKKGLINVSGFHVDPGFSGRLQFSVYNAGSQAAFCDVGEPFLIWFSDLIGKPGPAYDGGHNDQKSITSKDVAEFQGDVTSPAELKRQIDDLSRQLKLTWTIASIIFSAVVAVVLGSLATSFVATATSAKTKTGGSVHSATDSATTVKSGGVAPLQ
jgi:dCTP deaminase